jgi:hypothetical protein
MSMIELRRTFLQIETIHHEFGVPAPTPQRRGAIAAVLRNPYAGRFEPDIVPMMKALEPLGITLAGRLLQALGNKIDAVQSYGKGAIVGSSGELEHGALWHVPGGYSMREVLGWKRSGDTLEKGGNALAIVPSTKKVGAPGCTIDIPLTHLNASYVRSHFDAFEVRVPGSPKADELIVILAMGCGPRVHARVGGLAANDISQFDGQR